MWQLNDCWPVLSWALLDYHGFGKAAYYAVRRAFAPVLASLKAVDDGLELWVVNDTGAPVRDTARVRVGTFAGDELATDEVPFEVPAHASRMVHAVSPHGGPDRYVAVRGARPAQPALLRGDQGPATGAGPRRAQLRGRCRAPAADTYAYFVHLSCPDEDAWFEDNYLELAPGEERTVAVRGADDLTVRTR